MVVTLAESGEILQVQLDYCKNKSNCKSNPIELSKGICNGEQPKIVAEASDTGSVRVCNRERDGFPSNGPD